MDKNNENSEKKDYKKKIHCKNCRQEILAEKMFLHEGFCFRNNIYCEHCDKVFLKQDFEMHLINSKNDKKRMLRTPDRPKKKEKAAKIRTINIYTSPIITRKKTTFEYIEMPMVEEYKINKPIIISENGQILSNKNNNEALLPYLGISSAKSNNKDNLVEEIITNQDEFTESNPILFNDNDLNMNKYIEASLRNSASVRNFNTNFNINFEQNNNIGNNTGMINSKINLVELTENMDFLEKSNNLKRSLSSNAILKNNNINDKNICFKNNINSSNNLIKSESDMKMNNINTKQNKNNIIINNNIITYNSNNNINKIHNFYNNDQNKPKNNDKSLMNNDIFQEIKATNFNPTRTSNKSDILKFKKNLEKNIKNNSSKKNTKEPNDRDSNLNSSGKKNKVSSYTLERSPQNSPKRNSNKKKINNSKICEFCNSIVDDIEMHYKIYHYKMNREILKPQKRDTVLLNEKLSSTDINETGIEENNRKILLREFKLKFNKNTTNPKNYKTEKKIKYNYKKFNSPKVRKVKKLNLDKELQIINSVEKSDNKYPEDNFRKSGANRTQARDYNEKRKIILNDNFKPDYKNVKINTNTSYPSNLKNEEKNFFKNDNSLNYKYTEDKKFDKYSKKQIFKSPATKKINLMKNIFDINNY